MSNTSTHSTTRRLAEGGICIALALVLSYLKIPIGLSFGGFGGSITLVMVPLILFAVRYGALWGILDTGAVDGNFAPIPEQQLHTAGAHVKLTGSCIVLHNINPLFA